MSISNVNGAFAAFQYAGKTQKTSASETTFAEKVIKTGKTDSEISEAEKLEAFKKEIWKEIDSLSWGSSISIQITDGAFEKMMNDPEFKNKMMKLIKEDARGSHIMCGGTLININESGFYGYSYMADHAKEANTAFEAHSKDKDSFYAKRIAKKKEYEELLEKRWLEREWQRGRLNKEYVGKLRSNRSLLTKELASAAYDASVMAEPVASGGFGSTTIGANV